MVRAVEQQQQSDHLKCPVTSIRLINLKVALAAVAIPCADQAQLTRNAAKETLGSASSHSSLGGQLGGDN